MYLRLFLEGISPEYITEKGLEKLGFRLILHHLGQGEPNPRSLRKGLLWAQFCGKEGCDDRASLRSVESPPFQGGQKPAN